MHLVYWQFYFLGQSAYTRAAAGCLVEDGRADPDPNIPIIQFDPNSLDVDWDDVQDYGGISHEGDECRDMTQIMYEYTVLPKYV